MRTEDEYIIHRCLNGEKAAFDFLVDKYKEKVYAFAWDMLHNLHDAEDVTQEVFIKAYRNLHTLRRWDNFLVWLRSITYNLCKDLIRERDRRPDREFIEEQDREPLDVSSSHYYKKEEQMSESLYEALDSLPDTYREILTLHYLGGMKCREIAQFLDKPIGTITKYLSRARVKLKKEMIDIDIWTAVAQGNVKAIKQHLDTGTDIDGTLVKAGKPGVGATPLHVAVIAGQMESTKLLIEKGANINARADDESGRTPLHWAAAMGRMKFVQVLVEAEADVNAKDNNGYTPLDVTSHDAIADFFCKHGGKTRSELIPIVATSLRGVYSVNGELYINAFGTPEDKPTQKITSGHHDMATSWSRENGKIVFFRVMKFTPKVATWRTSICVVNTDGTKFRKVTDGSMTDFDPTWTRNGKNDIVFTRYDDSKKQSVIYRTTAESEPGEEVVISELDQSEYALSSLSDGRIFINSMRDVSNAIYYLLTPKDTGGGNYEPVVFKFPVEGWLERLSIAPSETKITYEYKKGWKSSEYTGKTIYIADFNLETRTVSNPIAITDKNPCAMTMSLFPRWTKNENAVVYQSNKTGKNQLYMYRLKDGSTIRVSTNRNADYAFPCGEETPN